MSGISGCMAANTPMNMEHGFFRAIDLLDSGHYRTFSGSSLQAACCAPSDLLVTQRFFETDDLVVTIAGHIISERPIDWRELLAALVNHGTADFDALSGRFSIMAHDRVRKIIYLVTDRIGQYPFYVLKRDDGIFWSSTEASFTRLQDPPGFDERWLHEFFLCNFSPTHSSFLQGVTKLPAATVTSIDTTSGAIKVKEYSDRFRAEQVYSSPEEEVEVAKSVFAARVPLYVADDEQVLSGITSGFDSRVILASIMDRQTYSAYTYGVPGCSDLVSARNLADRLGLQHRVVNLDRKFEDQLSDLMIGTIWLSSGHQTSLRSANLYAYQAAAKYEPKPQVLVTGSSGDQLFRGHGNVPSIVSNTIDVLFRTGELPTDLAKSTEAIFVAPELCMSHMENVHDVLHKKYGDLTKSSAHLGYLTYEVPAEYFAGEGALAEHFMDYRTPFCDRDILRLAWSFQLSTLGNSRFLPAGPPANRAENFLHACLIAQHPQLARQPIQGRPLWAFTRNNAPLYYAVSTLYRLKHLLSGKQTSIPLEDWSRWFTGPMNTQLDSLLGSGNRIREYVADDYIADTLRSADPSRLNKLVSSEIIIRLVRNGWNVSKL